MLQSMSALAQQKNDVNGYLQYRFTDNYLDQTNFSIRRAKLWAEGTLPLNLQEWGYKVQAQFYNKQNFLFQLQDAFLTYSISSFKITAGQFVPEFTMQRKQSDYLIPFTERANVITYLVPSSETMGRDIGVQADYKEKYGGISFGFFNGNGANTVSNKRNFLLTNRGYFNYNNNSNELQFGYSLSYRKDNGLVFSNILGSSTNFSGKDFRYGFDFRIKLSVFEFQSEYLEGHLGSKKAKGFYALADYLITNKNLIAVSIEQLNDLNPSTVDKPWYKVGYSYLIKGNFIKISLDNQFQFLNDKTNVMTTLQVQYFFLQI